MEYICEDNRVSFLDFEKKVGAPATKAAEITAESGTSQSIVGDWKGAIALADARSFPAVASFSAASTGTITVADPSGPIKFQFQNLTVSTSDTITAITADGTNFLGKISADGKQITGDIILSNGTGHKISMTRP